MQLSSILLWNYDFSTRIAKPIYHFRLNPPIKSIQGENMTKENKQQTQPKKPTRRTRKISFRLSEAEYAQILDELAICGEQD
ncbi:hypothetical protein FACS1894187_13840 [Synergistales bacterium]|nr:hypothetical protein FACS1894187_13840 [Synergistales bacterium]